eukprot:TRINITY_DN5845_c0_g1_i3.p1 TRINITY_DN5845_c0_g1~~TRINITY_DN5845_c0_g1_i3.p1  ORF type:complete len:1815 (-),score=392.65 TRINITY_DN5845_c0_g1_i3:112-5556(-)
MEKTKVVLLLFFVACIASACEIQVDNAKLLQDGLREGSENCYPAFTLAISGYKDTSPMALDGNGLSVIFSVKLEASSTLQLTLQNFASVNFVVENSGIGWPIDIIDTTIAIVNGQYFSDKSDTMIRFTNVSSATIIDSSFERMQSDFSIKFLGGQTSLISNSRFSFTNYSVSSRGSGSLSVVNSTFLNGGTVILAEGPLFISDSVIDGNNQINSNPIIDNNFTESNLTNVSFRRNNGGFFTKSLIMNNSTVEKCTNGAIVAESVRISNSYFADNSPVMNNDGSAIRITNSIRSSSINYCQFVSNNADLGRGGAIYSYGQIEVNGCTFSRNSAYQGGALYADITAGVIVRNCIFDANVGETYGGAIVSLTNSTIYDSIFLNNTMSSVGNGAAIYSRKGLVVNNSTFYRNLVSLSNGIGGAILADNLTVIGCEFSGNYARYGGAVECFENFKSTDSKFRNNHALLGAAIRAGGTAEFWGSYEGGGNLEDPPSSGTSYSILATEVFFFDQKPTLNCDWMGAYMFEGVSNSPPFVAQVTSFDQQKTTAEFPVEIYFRIKLNSPPVNSVKIGNVVCSLDGNLILNTTVNPSVMICSDPSLKKQNNLKVESNDLDSLCVADEVYVSTSDKNCTAYLNSGESITNYFDPSCGNTTLYLGGTDPFESSINLDGQNTNNLTIISRIPTSLDTQVFVSNFISFKFVAMNPIGWRFTVLNTEQVQISGLNITNPLTESLHFESVSKLTMENINITADDNDSVYPKVSIIGTGEAIVKRSKFFGSSVGLSIANSPLLTVEQCEFRGNHRGIEQASRLYVRNSVFQEISSSGIEMESVSTSYLDLDNVTFSDGRAPFNAMNINMTGCTFTNNRVGSQISGVAYIYSSKFIGNYLLDGEYSGSALSFPESAEGNIISSLFSQNKAVGVGGAIYVNGKLRIKGSTFELNHARSGGAIYHVHDSPIIITDSVFQSNTAEEDGGAIFTSGFSLLAANTSFYSNIAMGNGGAIKGNSGHYVILNQCNFIFNSGTSGGSVYLGHVSSNSTKFRSNTATSNGAAIFGEAISVLNSEFVENSILQASETDTGSAIFSNLDVVVQNSTFKSNQNDEGNLGGTVHCQNFYGTDIVFKYNVGTKGSAIFASNSSVFYGRYEGGYNHRRESSTFVDLSIYSTVPAVFSQPPILNCDWIDEYQLNNGTSTTVISPRNLPQINLNEQTLDSLPPFSFYVRRKDQNNRVANLSIGDQSCTSITNTADYVNCLDKEIYGLHLRITSPDLCFPDPIFVDGLPISETQVKESINKIVSSNSSSITSNLFSAITAYFNSNSNATNPLVVSAPQVSISAFDVSRKSGNSISLDLGLYKSSTTFPNSILNQVLGSNQSNAFLVFGTFERGQTQFTSPVSRQGSIVYGLSLIDSEGKVIVVENTTEPITISLSLLSGLSDTDVNDLDCIWWNELESQWKNEGCTRKSVSKSLIECECFHLTNFTAGSLSKTKTEAAISPTPSNSPFPIAIVAGAAGGGLLLIIIIVVVVIVVKRRSKKNYSNIEMNITKINEGNDKLVLEEKIGTGAYSVVYRAIDSGTTTVAVKKLNAKEDKTAFLREADILKRLHHPNVVAYYDLFEDQQGLLCMKLEYMPGGNLLDLLRSQTVIYQSKLKIALDVVGALKYLESNSIIHADISCRNVLMREGPTAKLADFGKAREANEIKKRKHEEKPPIRWTAPEVLESQEYSHSSDVWSFGVLLFEIWSDGKIPYGEMSNEDVVKFVKGGGKLFPPQECNHKFLEIIQLCNVEVRSRKGFGEVSTELSNLLENFQKSAKDVEFHEVTEEIYVGK